MFDSLLASRPQARVGAHRHLLSLSVHGLLVGLLAALTRQPPATTHARPAGPEIFFVPSQPIRPSRPPATHNSGQTSSLPPIWHPSLEAPDLGPPVLSARVPTVADVLDGANLQSGAAPGLSSLGLTAGRLAGPELLTAAGVDEPVEILHQPAPVYPPTLAHARVAGRVEFQYVVDTTGRAEAGSLRALMSTHAAFEAAARGSVLASRYRPARLRGRAVRQLVRQTLTFRSAD
jgi:protein TonB